jgi:hypothetical protein
LAVPFCFRSGISIEQEDQNSKILNLGTERLLKGWGSKGSRGSKGSKGSKPAFDVMLERLSSPDTQDDK